MADAGVTEKKVVRIAAIAGLIGGLVVYLFFGFGLAGAIFVALLLALLVALVLWMMWRETAVSEAVPPQTVAAPKPTPAPAPAPAAPAAAEPAPAAPVAADPVVAEEVAEDAPAFVIRPSARLAGQEDLATRKGSWKYQPGGAEAAKPDAPAAEASATQDKPAMLAAPRAGGADDLKQIKGVGPKLEEMLHEMGIYHFDQIAGWTDREVAWADANLKGFKGRVSRDTWVEQAKILAAGGETAFSDKVKKGDVY